MDAIEQKRTRVSLHKDHVSNVSSIDFPGNFPFSSEDLSWSMEKFQQNFKIVISRVGKDEMEFDLIGADASLANAFRRILISEVPTMAIESVFIYKNSSIVHDEVLCHRLGLIPINLDPRSFEFVGQENNNGPSDVNTVVFKLNIKCDNNPNPTVGSLDPNDLYKNSTVYSRHLIPEFQGGQAEFFEGTTVGPVHGDIVIAKMRPGQQIQAEMHCQKGIGKEHAKWSPVATASYRLLPEIKILKPITGDLADKFSACFPKGVVEVFTNKDGQKEARVVNPRKDTVSREVLRHKEFEDKVRLSRIRDHFLFSIESTGALPPPVLFLEAVSVLHQKCSRVRDALFDLRASLY
ncbi:DNA-directed RNA polymerase [Zopfochytrium polystomum]|nr:DNA-directed RNA polymerase [Zopfochytrium polystomum]